MTSRAAYLITFASVMGCSAAPASLASPHTTSEPERCAATPRAEDPATRGASSIAREPIMRAFRRDRPRHTCCYEAHLARHPGAGGRAVLALAFDGPEVADADISDSSPELELDAPFTACLLETARRMRIPEWDHAPTQDAPTPAGLAAPGETTPAASEQPSWPSTVRIEYPLHFSTPMASN